VADGLLEDSGRRLRVTSFTRGEIVEIYEMRKLLEGAAAELAAVNIAADVVAELRDATKALFASQEAIDWNGRALAFDLRFHDALARGSGNERLYRDISRYRLLVRGLCRITGSQENLRQALAEHEQILAAIEARDPLAARDRMEAHIAARLEGVLNAMPA
jgi:DNA-binding GntR family transcriptional regulator